MLEWLTFPLHPRMSNTNRGFSLVEVLVALFVSSVLALALFQSTSQWLFITDRASQATNDAMSRLSTQRAFDQIVRGLIPAWPDDESGMFVGDEDGFSGLTVGRPMAGRSGLKQVRLYLRRADQSQQLVYASAGGEVVLRREIPNANAAFAYLDEGFSWSSHWLQADAARSASGDNGSQEDERPRLPRAIRYCVFETTRSQCWIARHGSDIVLPVREQDLNQ